MGLRDDESALHAKVRALEAQNADLGTQNAELEQRIESSQRGRGMADPVGEAPPPRARTKELADSAWWGSGDDSEGPPLITWSPGILAVTLVLVAPQFTKSYGRVGVLAGFVVPIVLGMALWLYQLAKRAQRGHAWVRRPATHVGIAVATLLIGTAGVLLLREGTIGAVVCVATILVYAAVVYGIYRNTQPMVRR